METIAALAAPSSAFVSAVGASSLIGGRSVQQRVSCTFGRVLVSGGRRHARGPVLRRRRDLGAEALSKFGLNASEQRKPLRVAAQSQDSAGNDVKVEEVAQELEKQAEESKAAYNDAVDALKEETLKVQDSAKTAFDPAAEKAIEVLRDTTEKLKEEAEKARALLTATALETAELGKSNLNLLAENAPDGPIKEVAESAVNAHLSEKTKQGAKIHDFCLGIPYGGMLVAGGLLWFILTGSTAAIRFGVILGGVLLALSVSSLKVWKQGKSSIPYIQGQAAIAAIIFIKDSRKFLATGGFFPPAVSALASGAMLAFYAYVYLAGGNPPKKDKSVNPAPAS
ncbi:hypothetical protein MPTK1_3g06250 [Marchantia polymorpha subsp. ruderalis]|uniref:Uncharacterized protein n=2 Tax=Marchantia polymorpha TaxID=3197 RepID=A0AAF6AXY9_MARPO|nr:hypothetical protein MARPO_0006s0095 [Marchantia polymorpha]BBN04623.1 hypothetical protein Mp_3g06250 [Marchantia polymorpha subsp. ruderalis]|eukprot:PTQ48059.1 hypothetical protein MARPO_0006s0095 [Marchantia polymorpha]